MKKEYDFSNGKRGAYNSKIKNTVSIQDVTIDHFKIEDVPRLVDYWHSNTKEFWASRGVKLKPLPPKDEHLQLMTENIGKSSIGICTVLYKGERIGAHPLTHRNDEEGVMHAHFWNVEFRKMGIATISYVKAMEWFFNNLNLQRIIFKTPKANTAPIRVKEKLKIPVLESVMFEAPILDEPVEAWLSIVERDDIPALKQRLVEIYGEKSRLHKSP